MEITTWLQVYAKQERHRFAACTATPFVPAPAGIRSTNIPPNPHISPIDAMIAP